MTLAEVWLLVLDSANAPRAGEHTGDPAMAVASVLLVRRGGTMSMTTAPIAVYQVAGRRPALRASAIRTIIDLAGGIEHEVTVAQALMMLGVAEHELVAATFDLA